MVAQLLGGLLRNPGKVALDALVVHLALDAVLLRLVFLVHVHQLLGLVQLVVDVLDVLLEGLPDAVDFVAAQRADEAEVLHVAFLVHAVVAQLGEGVDDRAEYNIEQQYRDEEEVAHDEDERLVEERVDVGDHVDGVAHAAAVFEAEVERLEEALGHLVTRRVGHHDCVQVGIPGVARVAV